MQNSNEQMRRELLPCPFCGGEVVDDSPYGGYEIRHNNMCALQGMRFLSGKDYVTKAWNTRAHTSAAEKQSMKERNYLLRIQDLEADVQRLTSLHNKAAEKYKGVVEAANLIEKWMQKHCMSNPYVAGFKKQVLSKLRQALANLEQE